VCSNYCYFLLPSFQNFTNSTKKEGWEVIQHLSCFVFYSHAFILCNILSIFFSLFDFLLFFCGDDIAIINEKDLMSCIQIISNYGLVLFHLFPCLMFSMEEKDSRVLFLCDQDMFGRALFSNESKGKFWLGFGIVAFFFYTWNSLAMVKIIRILIRFF